MATEKELKRYLAKRGYDTEVTKPTPNTWIVGLHCKTVEEVQKLLAGIEEPGRFIVSVQFTDVVDELIKRSGLPTRIEELRDEMATNTKRLQETDDSLRKQSEMSLGGLWDKIEKANRDITDRLDKLEKAPWWKIWRRR